MFNIAANGAKIPALGLGTWCLSGAQATELVAGALRDGYRHIDTAAMYDNEVAVGEGLRASGVAREEIFLTTKVWYENLSSDDLPRSLEASLKRLNVAAVDLVLIHWPSKTIALRDSIAALNGVLRRGLARNIGVSNFTTSLLDAAVALSDVPLACNQIEYHPYLNQDKLLAACRKHGMAAVSYCPLARGGDLFAEPAVAAAALAHGKTAAQIVLRWQVQQDSVAAIPRSSNPGRIRENLDIFDFALSEAEMRAISALRSRGLRICDFAFSPEWDRP